MLRKLEGMIVDTVEEMAKAEDVFLKSRHIETTYSNMSDEQRRLDRECSQNALAELNRMKLRLREMLELHDRMKEVI